MDLHTHLFWHLGLIWERERRFWNSHSQMACEGFTFFICFSVFLVWGGFFCMCLRTCQSLSSPRSHGEFFMTWIFFSFFPKAGVKKIERKKEKEKKLLPPLTSRQTTSHPKPTEKPSSQTPDQPQNITSCDKNSVISEWIFMHFLEFDNTVENFSGSRKLSHLYSFSSRCGKPRGPCMLSWRSVPRETWCLPSWMHEMQMLWVWPPFHRAGLDLCSLYWWNILSRWESGGNC